MRHAAWTSLMLIATLVALVASGAAAQTTLEGELGADLVGYDFSNSLTEDERDMTVSRSLSNQYLQMLLTGPVSSSHFANYSLLTRFSGTYYQVDSDDGMDDDYTPPYLSRFSGRFSLFPDRSYPLSFFMARAKDNSVRYEPANRSDFDNQKPGLAVVRSYWGETQSRGANFDLSLGEGTDFSSQYTHERTELRRRYDFGENRDIWVDVATFRVDPTAAYHRVDVANDILDDSVVLFIDFALVDTLSSGETLNLVLERGSHDVEFIPLRLSPYRARIDVDGDMLWRVLYTPPSGSKDRDQIRDAFTSRLAYGGEGAARGEARLDHASSDESVQGVLTDLTTFNNQFDYDLNNSTRLSSLTTWSRNDNVVEDISSQLSSQMMQRTSVKWQGRRQRGASLGHMYTRMSTDSGRSQIVSRTHQFDGTGSYATGFLNHIADTRLTATLLEDNMGYTSNQYSSEIRNRFAGWLGAVRWAAVSNLKYLRTKQENPGSESEERESRAQLEGERADFWHLGTLSVRGEHTWRDRETGGLGNDVKSLYRGVLSLSKSFGPNYRLSATLARELETFGGTVPTPAGDVSGQFPGREDQKRQNISIALLSQPFDWMNFGGNLALVDQADAEIRRVTMSSSMTVPRIGLPIRFLYSAEKRLLAGLPEQTRMAFETTLSYNFRQVRIVLKYNALREKLVNEDFRYEEIIAQISRRFQIY